MKYDDKDKCLKCGSDNTLEIKDRYDNIVCEAETTCNSCGHLDYWAYGFYMTKREAPESIEEVLKG